MGLLDGMFGGDPQQQGLLAGSMALLNAGGPSRMPISLGQALGQGMGAGQEAYLNAQKALQAQQEAQMMQQYRNAQIGKLNAETQVQNSNLDLSKQINNAMTAGDSNSLRMLGQRALALGHSGAVGALNEADKIDAKKAQADQWKQFQNVTPSTGASILDPTLPEDQQTPITIQPKSGQTGLMNTLVPQPGPNGSQGLDLSRVTPQQLAQLQATDPNALNAGVSRFQSQIPQPLLQRALQVQSQIDSNPTGDPKWAMGEFDKVSKAIQDFNDKAKKPQGNPNLIYDASRGGFVDKNTLQFTPATDASGNPVGVKPAGKEYSQPFEVTDPATNKTVLVRQDKEGNITPVPGGYAPKSVAAPLGSREMVFVKRIILSGNEAARDLNNVVKFPLTASTGVLGGRTQGAGLMDAGKEVLANKMTGEEAQTYNVMSTGFQRSLAAIEAAGLMPTGSLTHQMDTVLFKEGDTNYTKLMKLAQTRQIVEAGLESTISDPRIPEEIRASTKQIMAKMEKSVPFTVENLIDLKQKQAIDSNVTLKDVVKAQSSETAGVKTATNPKTGEKMMFKDGKWQPM